MNEAGTEKIQLSYKLILSTLGESDSSNKDFWCPKQKWYRKKIITLKINIIAAT